MEAQTDFVNEARTDPMTASLKTRMGFPNHSDSRPGPIGIETTQAGSPRGKAP